MKATWNGATLIESDDTATVEAKHHLPVGAVVAVEAALLRRSDTRTICPWTGEASDRAICAGGRRNVDAA